MARPIAQVQRASEVVLLLITILSAPLRCGILFLLNTVLIRFCMDVNKAGRGGTRGGGRGRESKGPAWARAWLLDRCQRGEGGGGGAARAPRLEGARDQRGPGRRIRPSRGPVRAPARPRPGCAPRRTPAFAPGRPGGAARRGTRRPIRPAGSRRQPESLRVCAAPCIWEAAPLGYLA